jgi:hypothetical protein
MMGCVVLQEKFEASPLFVPANPGTRSQCTAFPGELFFLFGYGRFEYPLVLLHRALILLERSVLAKVL